MANVLIAGCGYVGTALGERLAALGHQVWGLRRKAHGLPAGLHPLSANIMGPGLSEILPADIDFVFYTVSTAGGGIEAYRASYVDGPKNLIAALDEMRERPRLVVFTSSTSVYAQTSAEWVDERSSAEPSDERGLILLEGERVFGESRFRAVVVRLGGIYGPGRTRLLERVRAGEVACPAGPPRYTNRIHRDDCAGILSHLMNFEEPEELYIGVDHEPAEFGEMVRWLAERLGAAAPPGACAEAAPPRRSASNKRCSNARLLASGYRFLFPSFREGYDAIIGGLSGRAGTSNPG